MCISSNRGGSNIAEWRINMCEKPWLYSWHASYCQTDSWVNIYRSWKALLRLSCISRSISGNEVVQKRWSWCCSYMFQFKVYVSTARTSRHGFYYIHVLSHFNSSKHVAQYNRLLHDEYYITIDKLFLCSKEQQKRYRLRSRYISFFSFFQCTIRYIVRFFPNNSHYALRIIPVANLGLCVS